MHHLVHHLVQEAKIRLPNEALYLVARGLETCPTPRAPCPLEDQALGAGGRT